LHAAVALESLYDLNDNLEARSALAERYMSQLTTLPGIEPQRVPTHDTSTWKDFTISVDPGAFGVTRNTVVEALRAEGIDTRNYFDPPVHRQHAYATRDAPRLPCTDRVASRVISLPLYRQLTNDCVDRVISTLSEIHEGRVQLAQFEQVVDLMREEEVTGARA
jgi:dTDP-4-amino-4,6-dideoxygalactose transaminase